MCSSRVVSSWSLHLRLLTEIDLQENTTGFTVMGNEWFCYKTWISLWQIRTNSFAVEQDMVGVIKLMENQHHKLRSTAVLVCVCHGKGE